MGAATAVGGGADVVVVLELREDLECLFEDFLVDGNLMVDFDELFEVSGLLGSSPSSNSFRFTEPKKRF